MRLVSRNQSIKSDLVGFFGLVWFLIWSHQWAGQSSAIERATDGHYQRFCRPITNIPSGPELTPRKPENDSLTAGRKAQL